MTAAKMDQANTRRPTPYGIAGDGRVASHVTHYFDLLGLPYRQWSRRREATEGVALAEAFAPCRCLLLAVSDRAITSVAERCRCLDGEKTLIHFSGGVTAPEVQGMHPLCTFGRSLYDLQTYQAIPFICEPGPLTFAEVFPELENPSFLLPLEAKPLYHAVCVLAGNHTALLWNKLFHTFEEQLGLPREAARPYLIRVFENLKTAPEAAETGPLSRRDVATIHANLAALAGDPFQAVYRAFVDTAAPGFPWETK
jgi:hypothetical protein